MKGEAMKPMKSDDPNKKAVVALLKKRSNCGKVTDVVEHGGMFSGVCFSYDGVGYRKEGTYTVTRAELEEGAS
jgi:hypothetical protein